MDISVIEQLVGKVGISVTITIVSIWFVLDVYKFIKTQIVIFIKKQSVAVDTTNEGIKEITLSLKHIGKSIKEIKAALISLQEEGVE